jgi:hypothetical protein
MPYNYKTMLVPRASALSTSKSNVPRKTPVCAPRTGLQRDIRTERTASGRSSQAIRDAANRLDWSSSCVSGDGPSRRCGVSCSQPLRILEESASKPCYRMRPECSDTNTHPRLWPMSLRYRAYHLIRKRSRTGRVVRRPGLLRVTHPMAFPIVIVVEDLGSEF